MKPFILSVCLLLLITHRSYSQQTHFIYIQTENRAPFYVSLNQKNYSSSSIGYIILPKLVNGEYRIVVGFPANAAEQDYMIQVKDNDQGYLLKEFGEKGWALFNLQNMAMQYAGDWSRQQAEAKQKAAAIAAAEARQKAEELAKRQSDSLAIVEATRKAELAIAAQVRQKAEELAQAEAKQKADSIVAANTLATNKAAAVKRAEELAVAEATQQRLEEEQGKKDALTALRKEEAQAGLLAAKKRTDSLASLKAVNDELAKKAQETKQLNIAAAKQKQDSLSAAQLRERNLLAANKKEADEAARQHADVKKKETISAKQKQDSLAAAQLRERNLLAANKKEADEAAIERADVQKRETALAKEKQDSLAAAQLRERYLLAANKKEADAAAQEQADSVARAQRMADSVYNSAPVTLIPATKSTPNTREPAPKDNRNNADSIYLETVPREAKPIPENPALAKAGDAAADTKKTAAAPVIKLKSNSDSVKFIEISEQPAPQLIHSITSDSGITNQYILLNGATRDTVNTFIRSVTKSQTPVVIKSIGNTDELQQVKASKEEQAPKKQATKQDTKFLDIEFNTDSSLNPVDPQQPATTPKDVAVKPLEIKDTAVKFKDATDVPKTDTRNTPPVVLIPDVPVAGRANCSNIAVEKDFFSLRKKMASAESTDDMVLAAKKVMKEKCFSTLQIRNLSGLFLSDADRYQFLDAVYPLSFDPQNFMQLSDMLIDPYYKERFRTMIRK